MSIKYGILGLLAERPMHGYDLRGQFEELLGGTWDVNIGQVYTTLQRLERDGLIEAAGERGDRGRLSYRLTPDGRRDLQGWLATPEDEPLAMRDAIFVKLLLAGRVANGRLAPLLRDQRRVYLQRLSDLAGFEESARREHRDDLARLLRGARLHTEANVKWIDELMDEVDGRERPDGGDDGSR